MKYCALLLSGILLLALKVQATSTITAPIDTIPGHGALVHILADSLCARLAQRRQVIDFRQLPPRQSGHILDVMLNKLIHENQPAVENILFAVRPEKQVRYRRQLGRDIVLYLAESCPTAHQVITDISYPSLRDKSPLPPEEQAVLLPIAWRINQQLREENRRDPLEDRPRAEEHQVIAQSMHTCLFEASPILTAYYGPDALTSPDARAHVSERLVFILLNLCPQYILMLTMH